LAGGLTAARDREHRSVHGVELGGCASAGEQFERGEVAAAGGQGERAAANIPPIPRQIDIGAGVDQGGENWDVTTSADRVVQAAVGVDVYTVVEEPAQPDEVFEVELVVDQILKSRPVQRVQQRGVGLLAGVVRRRPRRWSRQRQAAAEPGPGRAARPPRKVRT
jgi:hypothetical protein